MDKLESAIAEAISDLEKQRPFCELWGEICGKAVLVRVELLGNKGCEGSVRIQLYEA